MPYLQLRITLDPSRNATNDHVRSLLAHFKNRWIAKQDDGAEFTCGFEQFGKLGQPVSEHFHLHLYFESPDLKDPLRSAREFLKRTATERGFKLKGNKQWVCTLVGEPKDYDRWIRYPLKEQPCATFCSLNFPVSTLKTMHEFAREERKRSIELNILKQEKLADKISFKDKLFKHLDGLHTAQHKDDPQVYDLPNHQTIWTSILIYYTEQGKSVCFNTINGYTILYQLHIRVLSPEQCYVMRNNPQ